MVLNKGAGLGLGSSGIEKARNLASHLCKEAAESISDFPPSAALAEDHIACQHVEDPLASQPLS